jgi:hypothetical protein
MASFDELALQYVVVDDEVVMRDLASKAARGSFSAFNLGFLSVHLHLIYPTMFGNAMHIGQMLPWRKGCA